VEAGRGGGHLARCIALVRDLRALGREAFLFLGPAVSAARETLAPLLAELEPPWILREAGAGPWHFIVLDRFRTPVPEYRFWASLAFLVGIDEGGPCRDSFDFLIDLLPGPPGRSAPNLFDPRLLPLPDTRHGSNLAGNMGASAGPLRVLISFGAEDAAGLGRDCAAALCPPGGPGGFHITLVDPRAGNSNGNPAGSSGASPEGFTRLRSIPGLAGRLAEYDLLITHFGLGAFEALRAGTPALLVSPGPYHERLARAAGFFSAGIRKRGVRRLRTLLLRPAPLEALRRRCDALARRYGLDSPRLPDFAELLAAFEPAGRPCPGCGEAAGGAVLARFPGRTFRRCSSCGMVYMGRTNAPPVEYVREYFFDFYRKQYGKTYIEDFPQLMDMGRKRLSRIRALRRGTSAAGPGKLLDIGCAYGPFLKAAAQEGFSVCGIDPAEDAVRYVRETLGLSAFRGFFPPPEEPFSPASFSVITLWYVIEHIKNLGPALDEAGKLLEKGGILAFSTPSCSGISAGASFRRFLEKSPEDHWTIWNPRIARTVLKRRGFVLKKTVSTGHHPERFPLLGRLARGGADPQKGLCYRFLFLLSRIFRLGDTFEAYAVKR
jgi:SAM-dependent methyltransferase